MSDTPYDQISPGYAFASPKRRFAWVTWTIVGSTVAVFLLQLLELHLEGYDVVGDTLAFSGQAMDEHRYWTVITYAWVHAVAMFGNSDLFWLHIVANMIPLIGLGPALEDLLGRWRFLGLYLGGAIAAVLVWHFLNLNSDDPIIGASGAVFAVIAAVGTAAPRAKVTLFLLYVLPITLSMWAVALLVCGAELVQIIFNWMPEVAHSAHLGGAAFGFLYVLAYRWTAGQSHLSH
jgi:membrane associated rhomboid family serine protease